MTAPDRGQADGGQADGGQAGGEPAGGQVGGGQAGGEPAGGQVVRLRRGRTNASPIDIVVDGEPIACYPGETIATALLARRAWIGTDGSRHHGLWCGIGVCFECVVAVDGVRGVRACMTRVQPGMEVRTELPRPDGTGGDEAARRGDAQERAE